MSLDKKRDDLGKLFTCLLVSRKGACSLRDLERDYIETEGRDIPFRDFGCHSVLDLLRSLTKYVQLSSRNGTTFIHPVVSDKIKHVNDLVERQKSSKKTTGRQRFNRSSQYYPAVRPPRLFVPNPVQKEVAHMLTQHPSGVNKRSVAQCLQESQAIAGTVNEDNVDDYLNGVSHIAATSGNLVYPSRSLNATVNAERRNTQITNEFTPEIANKSINPQTLTKNNCSSMTDNYPVGSEIEDELYFDAEYVDYEDGPLSPSAMNNYHTNDNEYELQHLSRVNYDIESGTSGKEFIEQYQRLYSQYNLSENNNMEEYYTKDNSKDSEELCENECTFLSDDEISMDIISPKIKSRLQKLINKYPDGIYCVDLPQIYLEEFKVRLDYVELGFASLCEFASRLKDIFHLHRWTARGDFILYDANKPLPESPKEPIAYESSGIWEDEMNYESDDETSPHPILLPLQLSERLIPQEVLAHRETVGQQSIPTEFDVTDCFEVYVAEVFTPSLFWIHLRKKRSKLNQLMEAIHEFYQREEDKYKIPHVVLEKGLNCVCVFEGKWHRAIIKTVKPDGDVTLIFYDYGTTKTYPPDAVRFLHRRFSNLPAQSIPCGLFNIKPIKCDAWTRGTSSEFWLKVADIPLIALVAKIDRENNSMLVSLVDTQDEEDLHINDWMVQQGLAEFGSMVRTRPSNFVVRNYYSCLNYRRKLMKIAKQVSRQKNSHVVPLDTESSSSSKAKLKYANHVKNFMAQFSKYQKECNKHVLLEHKTTDQQTNSCSVNILTKAKKIYSPLLKNIKKSQENIIDNRSSSTHKSMLNLMNQKRVNIEKVEKSDQLRFLPTSNQSKNSKVMQTEDSTSVSSHSDENCIQTSDENKLQNDSKDDTKESFLDGEETSGKLEYSGTFRSFYGGQGHIEPINWSQLRSKLKQQETSSNSGSNPQVGAENLSLNSSEESTQKFKILQKVPKFRDAESKKSLYPKMTSHFQKVIIDQFVNKSDENKIPLAKDSFLNAVKCNKDRYYSTHNEKLWWSPEGNIQDRIGIITPLLRTRRKSFKETDTDTIKVQVSPEILNTLRSKNLQNQSNDDTSNYDSDSELNFLIQLKKKDNSHAVGLSKSKDNKDPINKTSNAPSNNRFTTLLNYMNKKKKTNVTATSTASSLSASSSMILESDSIRTPPTSSRSSNLDGPLHTLVTTHDSQRYGNISNECQLVSDKKDSNKRAEVTIQSQASSSIHTSLKNSSSKSSSLSSKNSERISKSDQLSQSINLNKDGNFYDTMNCNQVGLNSSDLPNLGNEVLEVPKKTESSPSLCENLDLILKKSKVCMSVETEKQVTNTNTKKQNHSDNVSELDSDDLTHSYSGSEPEIPQMIPINTTIVESSKNIESSILGSEKVTVITRDSKSEETEDNKEQFDEKISTISQDSLSDNSEYGEEQLKCNDMPLQPENNEQIETCVAQIKFKFPTPIFNDVDMTSDSDDWEVNGEWKDFMEKGDVMTRFIHKLEIENNASESAKIIEINDKSELDNVFNEVNSDSEQKIMDKGNENSNKICNTINSEVDKASDYISRKNFSAKLELLENNIMETMDHVEISETDVSTSTKESDQLSNTSISIHTEESCKEDIKVTSVTYNTNNENLIKCNERIFCSNSQENKSSLNKINDMRNITDMSMENRNQSEAVNIPEEKLANYIPRSKTKSIHEMLNNLKLKKNLSSANHDFKKTDSTLDGKISTPAVSELQVKESRESQISSGTDGEISGDRVAEKLWSESEMFADLSNTSSSSKCSLNLCSSDMIKNRTDSAIAQSIVYNKPQASSSSDTEELIGEQQKIFHYPFSILSKIKEKRLSAGSPKNNWHLKC